MQFSLFALAALTIGSVIAKDSSSSENSTTTVTTKAGKTATSTTTKAGSTKTSSSTVAATSGAVVVHVVTVSSSKNNTLTYTPNNLKAAAGDMVQFQFGVGNHTITQSNFDNPCEPISLHTNLTALYSGFMPVTATATTTPTYTIMINATTPLWFYCSQAKHCQGGMVMVINENTAANATRSLTNYAAGAKQAVNNLFPGQVVAGGSGGNTAVTTTGAASGATATLSSGSATTTSSGAKVTGTGAASSVRVNQALGGSALLAVLAFFL